jgi:hypothetical protein
MTFRAESRIPPSDGQWVGEQFRTPATYSAAHPHLATAGASTDPRPNRWIVLVAKGQDELYEHLRHAFSTDRQVEVIVDRRASLNRNPCWVFDRLRTHGVAVIRKESPAPDTA